MIVARISFAALFLFALSARAQAPDHIEEARNVLREGAESGEPRVRIQAIQATGLIGPNTILITRLEQFLSDGNVDVRVAAVNALADLKSRSSIPRLENTLKNDTAPEVTFAAAKALYALDDPGGRAWLLDVYNGTEKATSDALHTQSRKIFNNFHSFESAGSFIVTQGIGYVPVPGVGAGFSAVTGLLSDPDLSPRAVALMLLSREKHPEIDILLKQALSDKDWSVRAASAQMIAYTARTGFREDLVPLLSDKNEKVRFRAAGAYLHLAILADTASPPASTK
jgi:HEAT repeat protein